MRAARFDSNIGTPGFSKKAHFMGSASDDPATILMGVTKICLKSLLECVRLKTFSSNGYQQLQLDLHYMALSLRPLALRNAQFVCCCCCCCCCYVGSAF